MTPKLWLEALDTQHRYGSLLHHYWQRWELSRTHLMFFEWLDRGRGALVDLPSCPRRVLEESAILYLRREERALCEVEVADGRLIWSADGEPVTLPAPADKAGTPRARAVAALIEGRLETSRRRGQLLREARARVQAAEAAGEEATAEALAALAAPLVREGMLRKLRDPYFAERQSARASDEDAEGYRRLWRRFRRPDADARRGAAYALPEQLLPGLGWADVTAALDHEEGSGMRRPLPSVEARLTRPGKGGIFVVDQFGRMYAGNKVSGVFHHSSLTCGHCCKFAGAFIVEDGRVLKLLPHSGHYIPTQDDYDELIERWAEAGLDLSEAEICGMTKKPHEKRPAKQERGDVETRPG